MPKVSIVIPTYKAEKYIERCVRSLFEQTLDSIEYIFIDDCSPDNSIAVMQKVLEEYPQRKDQVKVIRHEVNQGVGAARNHGVAACTGDYIIHCDPDDWVDINMYEAMYNKAIETNADMVYCDFYIAKDFQNYYPQKQSACVQGTDMIRGILLGSCHGGLGNKLYKKVIATKKIYAPEDIIMCEDVLRNVQMLAQKISIVHLPQSFYYYFVNSFSITQVRDIKCFKSEKKVVDFIEKNIIPVYNCQASLNTYKRRILRDAIIFNHIAKKEFKTLWQDAQKELFTHIKLADPLSTKIILIIGCCSIRTASAFYHTLYKLKILAKSFFLCLRKKQI